MEAKIIEHNGQHKSIRQWAKYYGIPYNVLRTHIKSGQTVGEIVSNYKPGRPGQKIVKYDGKEYTIANLARQFDVNRHMLYTRIFQLGWTVEDAVSVPRRPKHICPPPVIDRAGCTKYDCVYQDGSGKCRLGHKKYATVCEDFYDAFEYYYGNEIKYKKDGKDPWAAERKLLIG